MNEVNRTKLNIRSSAKKKAISVLTLVITAATLIGICYAWLSHNGNKETLTGAGFQLTEGEMILPSTYKVTTSYYGLDKKWHDIATNYDESLKDSWTLNDILVAGNLTEFKTEITSLVSYDQTVSVYLRDISVDEAFMPTIGGKLSPYISIGTHTPATVLFSDDHFKYDSEKKCYTAENLTLAQREKLPAKATFSVEWYISSTEDIAGGDFPALYKDDSFITQMKFDQNFYWAVVGDESAENPTAYLANERGTLYIEGNSFVKYSGSYDGVTVKTCQYDDSQYRVWLDGLYVTVG